MVSAVAVEVHDLQVGDVVVAAVLVYMMDRTVLWTPTELNHILTAVVARPRPIAPLKKKRPLVLPQTLWSGA